jgi:histidinol phosphatase-like PHP family hydrolase
MLTNRDLSELMIAAAGEEEPGSNREKALRRAARMAFFWPVEASWLREQDRPLTELASVGPWLAGVIEGFLADPSLEPPEPPPLRGGFLTLAEVRATVQANPEWMAGIRADLQMHTTWSDGGVPLSGMIQEAHALFPGYEFLAITDHSKTLKIARGMDEAEMAEQWEEIATVNGELDASGSTLRVLRSLEMNISPEGEQDMDPEALARLDLVLGAFHSKLRLTEDQTDRYLRALENPTFHVMAHPRGRMFDRRLGLSAEWPRVFEAAAALGKAVEIDANPNRQDLDVELLKIAREAGVWVSIGTDAHSLRELEFMEFGVATAIRAGFPRERILNYQPVDAVLAFARP